jgi:hypothetical protein
MIRIVLPYHLRNLARVPGEVAVAVEGPVTLGAVLDALEAAFPTLSGTIRDHLTRKRRPLVRFYACMEDISNEPPSIVLPEPIARGEEPLLIIGAIAGG